MSVLKLFQRIIGWAACAAFVGLVTVEAYHAHKAVQNQSEANCAVCKIARQTPALIDAPPTPPRTLVVASAGPVFVPHPYLQFVFASHGLSPPVL